MKSQACYLQKRKSDPKACGVSQTRTARAAGANPPTARFWASPLGGAHWTLGGGSGSGAFCQNGHWLGAACLPAIRCTRLTGCGAARGVSARALCAEVFRPRDESAARGRGVDRPLAGADTRRGRAYPRRSGTVRSDTDGSASPDSTTVSSSATTRVNDRAARPSAGYATLATSQAAESTRLAHAHFCDCLECLCPPGLRACGSVGRPRPPVPRAQRVPAWQPPFEGGVPRIRGARGHYRPRGAVST